MCSVRPECLTYAFAMGERHGIWGGLSERDRRTLRVADPGLRRSA
jgi:WhiB family transcriptional regulator, redox-sensing transcriptional regulator